MSQPTNITDGIELWLFTKYFDGPNSMSIQSCTHSKEQAIKRYNDEVRELLDYGEANESEGGSGYPDGSRKFYYSIDDGETQSIIMISPISIETDHDIL